MSAMLADRIREFVVSCLDQLEGAHLPGLRLPRVFAGHEVGADTRADLVFTLGLLAAGYFVRSTKAPEDEPGSS